MKSMPITLSRTLSGGMTRVEEGGIGGGGELEGECKIEGGLVC